MVRGMSKSPRYSPGIQCQSVCWSGWPLVPTWITASKLTTNAIAIAIQAGIAPCLPINRLPSKMSQANATSGISGIRKR